MTPHYLRFARAIALASTGASAFAVGCGGAQPEPAANPIASPTAAPSSSASAATVKYEEDEKPGIVQGDPTEGYGPCRCSWDTKADAAPRVCKPGEKNHVGVACVRGTRPKYGGGIMIGPLPPPDLVA